MRSLKKLSIIVPVYYNAETLWATYHDIEEGIINQADFDCEIIFVNDGSGDNSWNIIQELEAAHHEYVRAIKLSRNFGSQYAVLCGFNNATGDCITIKAADRQEPIQLILDMVDKWKEGYDVVMAERVGREDSPLTKMWSNTYYKLIRKFAFSNMPKYGFDIFLLDRKACDVLCLLDEKDSSTICQVLWMGFHSICVPYVRLARKEGKSRWSFGRKVKLVQDSFYNYSTLPSIFVSILGVVATAISVVWGIFLIVARLMNKIVLDGWTTIVVLQLFCFGVTMLTLSVLTGYLWRIFIRTSNRPSFIIDEVLHDSENCSTKKQKENVN